MTRPEIFSFPRRDTASMAEGSESGWQLTESDPGVFSELLHKLGVPLIVDDLYSLDSESLVLLKPIHALIFLFKYVGGSGSGAGAAGGTSRADPDFGGFFAHQTVNNACATLAVLNALGNLPNVTKASTNEEYKNLMGFAGDLDPQSRGIVITSADWLREAHNSLSPPSAISLDGLGLEKGTEEVRSLPPIFLSILTTFLQAYHFVVYLPVGNTLYELDGLREFAVNHGSFSPSGEGWLGKAREVIQARIAIYEPGAVSTLLIHFWIGFLVNHRGLCVSFVTLTTPYFTRCRIHLAFTIIPF